MIKKVLTIAGTDCSGGAGTAADVKTITANGKYAMSVITAVVAQNTLGVRAACEMTADMVAAQADCVFSDIMPDSVKIGMVPTPEIADVIADKLREYGAKNIVLDTVMVSTSGFKLISDAAINALKERLIPQADIITPNIPEAEVLSGIKISDWDDMIFAAEKIAEFYGGAILVKGGHMINDAADLLYQNGRAEWIFGKRIENPNTHGTGCTLSSAIACGLADGMNVRESVEAAKAYLSGALSAMLDLGGGSGPVNHIWDLHRAGGF